jgi:Cu/Ag efflux protein CusF
MPDCRFLIVMLVALTANAPNAGAQQIDSHESAPIEYLVAGTVVWADAGSSSVIIRGSDLLGHLRIRVRSYRVKQASALIDLRSGDKITAIFSRRDGMLHRLRGTRISGAERGRR